MANEMAPPEIELHEIGGWRWRVVRGGELLAVSGRDWPTHEEARTAAIDFWAGLSTPTVVIRLVKREDEVVTPPREVQELRVLTPEQVAAMEDTDKGRALPRPIDSWKP